MSMKSIDRHNRRVDALNRRNQSQLRRAAQDGNLVAVQRLIRDGAIVNKTTDHWNLEPAIFGAIESQHYQTKSLKLFNGNSGISGENFTLGFFVFFSCPLDFFMYLSM